MRAEANPEKLLYQMAIERVLDRLSRAPLDARAEALAVFQAVGRHMTEPGMEEAARTLTRILFPELAERGTR